MQRFITVEGGEGVGKSLFCQNLQNALTSQGQQVLLTREPGGTPLANAVRQLFITPPQNQTPAPLTELYLVAAARSDHVLRLIKPALSNQQSVICDRYYDSTRVYQGILGGVDAQTLDPLLKPCLHGVEPDITFLLDCPVAIAMERIAARQGQELSRYDQATSEGHERMRQAYLGLAKRFENRIRVLDAAQAPEHVIAQALSYLE